MSYQKPKGTNDLLPGTSEKWQFIEEIARIVFRDYQYEEIRTPMFEHYEVISRSVGNTTDIVSKEMYDFYDKGERHITLRPEGTAPIVRSFIENKLFGPEYAKPYKLYYMGPMFRYERPQAGRLRQFHQIGAEAFGSDNPAVDVESMAMALAFFQQLGIQKIRLVINSLGDKATRSAYRQALLDYLKPQSERLSEDSRRRLDENPLRILDSKDRKDQQVIVQAPSILDYLSEDSSQHFERVKQMLTKLDISFEVDSTMVRGLDYYTDTIFEIMSDAKGMGTQSTICAGGRYDGLVEELGGPKIPGFGFALGIERVLLTMAAEEVVIPAIKKIDVFIIVIGEKANAEALKLVQSVRKFGFSAEREFMNRKPKAQFKTAMKVNAELILTIGETEVTKGAVQLKVMKNREERTIQLNDIYNRFDEVYNEMIATLLD